MCKAFSCLVTRGNKVYWKAGLDSHDEILSLFQDQDVNLIDNKTPPFNTFARVEIVPPKDDYLNTNFGEWEYKVGERIKPDFMAEKNEEECRDAFLLWAKEVYTFNVEEARNPIRPFKIIPPSTITDEHLSLLKDWARIWGGSVRASVGDSVWDSVGDSVGDSIWASVGDSIWNSVGASVRNSVGASIWNSVGDSVWNSVRNSVRNSVGDSIWAYYGSLSPSIQEWKYIDYSNPLFQKGVYPFQPTVDLWKMGIVPSYDGKDWRLHVGPDARILWEESIDRPIEEA